MKTRGVFLAMTMFALVSTASLAAGPTTQVDALIEKLIEKGILTKDEADSLKSEITHDAGTLNEAAVKKGVPEWAQNIKISGDMRVRLQDERREGSTAQDRVRGRYRARLNLEAKVNDKAKAVIGIATDGGSNNPRSTNVTFSGTTSGLPNSKPNVILNKAYGQYTPNEEWSLTAGKIDNPLWEPLDFLWDSDITPEGGAVGYKHKLTEGVELFTTGGLFMLGEFSGSSSDPFMWVGQAGIKSKLAEKADAKLAFMYAGYANIKSGFSSSAARPATPTATSPTNTNSPATGNALLYDYSAPTGAVEIGFNDPLGEGFPIYIPRIGLFGEYTVNPSPQSKNVAWMAGAYMGNPKVGGWGTWKATAAYKVLGKDAWLDILPDSDFYGGGTDIKGVEGILEVGLMKNLSFAFDYYHARRISSNVAKAPEHLWQADLNWKF